MSRALAGVPFLAAVLFAGAASAQPAPQPPGSGLDKPLVIPQVEGERQGKIVGRAIACGTPRERTDAVLQAARQAMLARVGGPFTENRYLPALGQAITFETSLGRPSDEACAKALDAFERFAATP